MNWGMVAVIACLAAVEAEAQKFGNRKVFVIASMEGSDGIFNRNSQTVSLTAPRWVESRKLMTDNVNAVVDGLLAGGASDVVVLDAYDTGQAISALDIHPKAILLSGRPMTPTLELDSSYAAVVMAGLPAMAGTEDAVLAGTYDFQNIFGIWVNGKQTGAIGARTMLAGSRGVPVAMMYGDEAACKELRDLVPAAQCAVIKWAIGRGGRSLSHQAACDLIRKTAQQAMAALPGVKPYRVPGPVEVKVEFTTGSRTMVFRPQPGIEQINARTWMFSGKDIVEAWLKFGDF